MTEQDEKYFEALAEKRRNFSKQFEDEDYRGIKDVIVEKYSDQAHFIYELLQNADDALATRAEFILREDKLLFKHNGTEKFTITNPHAKGSSHGHINAITSIGNSNKDNKIGKFGIGFKAVFQYTDTPAIFESHVAFRIKNFIVPERLPEHDVGDETIFAFPFDKESCPPPEAFKEISEKLRALKYPILFLTNLQEVKFDIAGNVGSYKKEMKSARTFGETSAELIKLTGDKAGEQNLWLFSRKFDGKNYSVGYFLEQGRLKPVEEPAFCFFPTKRLTKLKFIIHAPFMLTTSREGIKAGEAHNEKLIELLTALAAESLIYLRDFELIDDGILKIIPINESDFDVASDEISFKPFFTTVKKKMQSEKLLPRRDGYTSSENAYWADAGRLTEIFSDRQLGALVQNPNAAWVFTTVGKRNAGYAVSNYITAITKNSLDEDNLFKLIDAKFIETQLLGWFHTFYKWLSETTHRIEIAKRKPFFLTENGKASAARDGKNLPILFLPNDSGYPAINSALLENPETKKFLIEKIGLGAPKLKDEIYNKILPRYKDSSFRGDMAYFKKIFAYYKQCSYWEGCSYVADLKDNLRLRTRSGEYFSPKVLYMPEPKLEEYLAAIAEVLGNPGRTWQEYFPSDGMRHFLDKDFYLNLVGADNEKFLLKFFEQLGITEEVHYLPQELNEKQASELGLHIPNSYYKITWRENVIDGSMVILEDILDNEIADRSFVLWRRLIAVNQDVGRLKDKLVGRRFAGKTSDYLPVNVNFLRTEAWLVDKAGKFKSPEEISIDDLADDYDTTSDSAREVLAFFGIYEKPQVILTTEQQRLINKAKRLEEAGVTDDEIEKIISQKLAQKQILKLPSSPIQKISPKKIHQLDDTQPQTEKIYPKTTTADDFFKPAIIDYGKKLERAKSKSDAEEKKITRLAELQQKILDGEKYSFGWCKSLLELELLNSNESNSKEISISFGRVERDHDTQRTLILKYPNRYIPQFMEDLENIPLVLRTAKVETNVEIEVAGIRHNTLNVKLKDSAKLDAVNLSEVVEARINAKNPVFLIEELKKQFDALDFADDFNLRDNLCENIEFVFGPPGTGKTTHLADKILSLMEERANKKILVLTPTNKAADVLVNKILDRAENKSYLDWLLRFGTTNDAIVEKSGVFHDKTFDILSKPKIVTVTTIARFPYDFFMTAGKRNFLREMNWDYIIIDEASMIMLAQILLPLYKKTPKKFIIAGDPFQVEPVTSIDLWKGENIYTMVELNSFVEPKTCPHDYTVTKLTTQYRSLPAIGEIFSRFAYGGILKHARADYERRPLNIDDWLEVQTLNIIKFPVENYESIYRSRQLGGRSSYQIYSALFTFEFARTLSKRIKEKNSDKNFSIGIISPYRAQADLIEKLFSSTKYDVQIGTIHTFQGDECDILITVFNTPPTISASPEMFLNRLNIINVAISRARDYLFIVMPDDNTDKVENLWLIKRLETLFAKEGYGEFSAQDIEKSLFGVHNYIEENSFATGHQNVNVYARPERKYEIRSEDNAVDVQLHEKNF